MVATFTPTLVTSDPSVSILMSASVRHTTAMSMPDVSTPTAASAVDAYVDTPVLHQATTASITTSAPTVSKPSLADSEMPIHTIFAQLTQTVPT